MRIINLTIISILLIYSVNASGQSDSDFIIVDEIADEAELLEEEYKNRPNVFFTNGISPNALEQISISIMEKQFDELHIYVLTKPGAIIFNSISVTTSNVDDYAEVLKHLACKVKNSVVIHSDIVFTRDEGLLLKQRLEEHTGLTFISQSE